MTQLTPLGLELCRLIDHEGPISVERYMGLCLGHPRYGYYITRDPLGAEGDFVTAPEISQIFGELIGLWMIDVWQKLGMPQPFQIVELGPGRGTLMSDALRAARLMPAMLEAASIHLVETSPVLRRKQMAALSSLGLLHKVSWHDHIASLPPGPTIFIANEFFDALPIRQYVQVQGHWYERMVGLTNEGFEPAFCYGLAPEPARDVKRTGFPGALLELPLIGLEAFGLLGQHLNRFGGAALIIDYGPDHHGFGDTLQAVKRHLYVDPLIDAGEADLTVHVNFAVFADAARTAGLQVHGPVTQGRFLRNLGIEARAASLKLNAKIEQQIAIDAAVQRLTGEGREAMGSLFKAMAVSSPHVPPLSGF